MSSNQPTLFADTEPGRVRKNLSLSNGESDGIFGWYKYVQDFPGDFASDWLGELCSSGDLVWEPFSGSGTTLLASKLGGYKSIGFDQSRFMVDVAKTKLDWGLALGDLRTCHESLLSSYQKSFRNEDELEIVVGWDDYELETADDLTVYPSNDKKLKKWISPRVVKNIRVLLKLINRIECPRLRRFAKLALARILVKSSNMALRPNICYKRNAFLDVPIGKYYSDSLQKMIADYEDVKGRRGAASKVQFGDARKDGPDQANVIFTSPPYPNDMEYVHQTRLELSLLGYVNDAKGLTEIKKGMISSSVKLVYKENEWQKHLGNGVMGVRDVHRCLAKTLEGKNWGWNPADMVSQYFGGMSAVFSNWDRRLVSGGVAGVVVGDSAFNGVLVRTDELLGELAEQLGFILKDIHVFRSRWNAKHSLELRESVVVIEKK